MNFYFFFFFLKRVLLFLFCKITSLFVWRTTVWRFLTVTLQTNKLFQYVVLTQNYILYSCAYISSGVWMKMLSVPPWNLEKSMWWCLKSLWHFLCVRFPIGCDWLPRRIYFENMISGHYKYSHVKLNEL